MYLIKWKLIVYVKRKKGEEEEEEEKNRFRYLYYFYLLVTLETTRKLSYNNNFPKTKTGHTTYAFTTYS
jgi:hypothetical protein